MPSENTCFWFLGNATPLNDAILTPNTVVHHTYDIAFWVRTGLNTEYSCVGCTLGYNRLGFRLASHHYVNDSLIVRQSENSRCSKNRSWPENGAANRSESCTINVGLTTYEGIAVYDGPNDFNRIHFAGFYGSNQTPKSYIFMNMQALFKSVAQIIRKASFDPDVPQHSKANLVGSHFHLK